MNINCQVCPILPLPTFTFTYFGDQLTHLKILLIIELLFYAIKTFVVYSACIHTMGYLISLVFRVLIDITKDIYKI